MSLSHRCATDGSLIESPLDGESSSVLPLVVNEIDRPAIIIFIEQLGSVCVCVCVW